MSDKKGVINLEQEARIMRGRTAFHVLKKPFSFQRRVPSPTIILLADIAEEKAVGMKVTYLPIDHCTAN